MPTTLELPILAVNFAGMRKVNTRNAENLHGMWSVFSKCSQSLEDGRRLENLSWRVWARETFCCEPQSECATTASSCEPLARSYPERKDLPELSASVETADSDESASPDDHSSSPPLTIQSSHPQIIEPTLASSRGREKHITSLGLEKMVFSIQEKHELEPLSPAIVEAVPSAMPSTDITPRPTSPSMNISLRSSESSSSTAPMSSPDSDISGTQTCGSDTSAELLTSHSIVRGFSPGHGASSYRSNTHLAPAPIPTKTLTHPKAHGQKKTGVFLLGGSSGEDDSSFEEQMMSQPKQSSLTLGLKKPFSAKKQTSFRDEVESRTLNNRSHEDEDVFESDEEDDTPGSAIDDSDEGDDDEDWEDDASESIENTANDKPLFQRVDSKPNLVSRRSLLTSLMGQSDRAAAFQSMASKSTPALKRSKTSSRFSPPPTDAPLQAESTESTLDSQMTPNKPIIMTTSNSHSLAFSPRTTRRHMLASEMTESLRKSVLWERQQKKSTANAFVKRRHTAQNLTNLSEYPGEGEDDSRDGSKNNSWNHYDQGPGEYNQVGW